MKITTELDCVGLLADSEEINVVDAINAGNTSYGLLHSQEDSVPTTLFSKYCVV